MPLCVNPEAAKTEEPFGGAADGWGKVSAVLFDMDGVLCHSEHLSRLAAVNVFAEMGVSVTPDDFVPFMGTGMFVIPFLLSFAWSSFFYTLLLQLPLMAFSGLIVFNSLPKLPVVLYSLSFLLNHHIADLVAIFPFFFFSSLL